MTNAAYSHEREDEARAKMLASWGIRAKGSAEVIPMRRDLGLRPVLDDDEPPARNAGAPSNLGFSFLDNHTREQLDMPATLELVLVACDAAASMTETVNQRAKEDAAALRAKAAELQLENAQLKGTLAEVRAKLNEVSFVVERLQIDRQGPPGVAGPRGADGRDGQRGPRGERGAMGPSGPRIVSWENDDSAFIAWPLGSDGRKAAPLYLRGMFEQYHAQVEGEDAAEEADAAAASRAVVEREAEAKRLGLPR